jgi:hypothetical protein
MRTTTYFGSSLLTVDTGVPRHRVGDLRRLAAGIFTSFPAKSDGLRTFSLEDGRILHNKFVIKCYLVVLGNSIYLIKVSLPRNCGSGREARYPNEREKEQKNRAKQYRWDRRISPELIIETREPTCRGQYLVETNGESDERRRINLKRRKSCITPR